MIKCKQCGLDVPQTSKRERLYCDDKCRMAFNRSNSEQNIIPIANTNSEQENNPIANIPNTHKSNPEQTLCKGCKKPVLPLVDICSECIAKGLTRKKLGLPDVERIQN